MESRGTAGSRSRPPSNVFAPSDNGSAQGRENGNGVRDFSRARNSGSSDSRRDQFVRTPDREFNRFRHDGGGDRRGDHHGDHSDRVSRGFHHNYFCYFDSNYAYYYYDNIWHHYPYYYNTANDCSYYYWGNRWYAYPEYYYQYCPANSFYFFVDLGDYAYRNVPSDAAQTQMGYYPEQTPVDVFQSTDPLPEAYAAFAQGDYYRSVARFGDAIRLRSNDGLVYMARAQSYIAIGDYRNAYEDILDGMERVPDWPKVKLNLLEIYSEPLDFDNHLASLELWVKQHGEDYRAHFVLGYVYYFLQEYDLAKAELVQVVADQPSHETAKRFLDEIYEKQQKGEDDAPAAQ